MKKTQKSQKRTAAAKPTPKDLSPRKAAVKGGAGNLGMKQKGWNPA